MGFSVKNIFLLLFSVFLSLAIAEFALRLIVVYDINEEVNNSCWHYAQWLEHHQQGENRPTAYSSFVHDTLLGWVVGPGLQNIEVGTHIYGGPFHASSTKYGTRVTGAESDTTNKPVIITLGNSFTFGDCVNDTESYPGQLQKFLPQYSVVNLGVSGWGIDQMYLRLKKEIRQYKPKYVVIECFFHDLVRAHMSFRDYAKPLFIVGRNGLELTEVPVPEPTDIQKRKTSKVWLLIKSKLGEQFNTVSISADDVLSHLLMDSIVETCRQNKAVPLFLHLPSMKECITGRAEIPDIFLMSSEKNKVEMLDAVPQIFESLKNETMPEKHFACHFSPLVNSGIAKAVSNHINTANVVISDSAYSK